MIAIIIPYYKINYFEETLKSLSEQTDKRFNVYIGNDNSTNDPLEIIEKYSSELNINYTKFNTNLGGKSLVQQWQRCIKLVNTEEWIVLLGDDDVLSENYIESFYKNEIEFNNIFNVVRFSTIKINQFSEPISDKFFNSKIEDSKDILLNNKRSSLSEYVFSKVKINEIGFKDLPLAWWSDVLAVLEFSNFGQIYSINEAYVKVRISDISISGNKTFNKEKDLATYIFYNYLLSNKKSYFSDAEYDLLLKKVSKLYINHKKNLKLFYKISIIYFKNSKFILYVRFIKKIIKSIIK